MKKPPEVLDYASAPKGRARSVWSGIVVGGWLGIITGMLVSAGIWCLYVFSHQLGPSTSDTFLKIDVGIVLVTFGCGAIIGMFCVKPRRRNRNQ